MILWALERPQLAERSPGLDWAQFPMTKKQVRTLEGIFADPVRDNIDWHDVESLLVALGAELTEARGSRVVVVLNGVKAVFHEPHPQKETMVRDRARIAAIPDNAAPSRLGVTAGSSGIV